MSGSPLFPPRGLSPHAWGNRHQSLETTANFGSIPTRVGEPIPSPPARRLNRVYPHTRGGTPLGGRRERLHAGLSPHAWGNRWRHLPSFLPTGSIPTRVGEPGCLNLCRAPIRVYPHTRGGTYSWVPPGRESIGLSPHAWGNHFMNRTTGLGIGSIPTRVGEPPASASACSLDSVYPHTRGGTTVLSISLCCLRGLSPHAWGNPDAARMVNERWGSIPTRVGEPLSARRPHPSLRVYPHTRGGTIALPYHEHLKVGLSPHAWGNRSPNNSK